MNFMTQRALLLVAFAFGVYLLMLALGRWLKRRSGVPFGISYQIFCIVMALYLPLRVMHLDFAAEPFHAARDLGAATFVLGSIVLIALMHRFLWDGYFERKRQTHIPKFLRELMALLIFVVTFLLVLNVGYQKNITGLVFTSTVAVGVIGFAMQDMIGSIISGIAIEIGKPFKPGDWLFVDHQYAEVIEVNWRSTRLRTNDHVYLDIPNNMIVKNTIVNLCLPTRLHAMRLRVGVQYSAPPNRVKEVLKHAAERAVGVMPAPPPRVFLVEFADSAITYEVKFWMEDHALYNECTDAIRTNIWYGLSRANIKIPFPIRTLQIDRARPKAGMPDTVREAVRRLPFFKSLDAAQTEQLLNGARLRRFGAGEHLIEQGAEGDSMFILLEGEAEVLVRRNGSETHVARLGRGDHFGEMSLLTGEQRSATVRAASDCELIEIDKAALAGVLQDNEKLLSDLSDQLAYRKMETEGILAATTEKQTITTRKREYAASFLAKLYSFFEL